MISSYKVESKLYKTAVLLTTSDGSEFFAPHKQEERRLHVTEIKNSRTQSQGKTRKDIIGNAKVAPINPTHRNDRHGTDMM